MEQVAQLPANERSELFSEAAAKKETTPAIIEKDFWVTWLLGRLFRDPGLSRLLMFKGGTSLSKVYRLIERFSEDIDLILDWRILTDEDPFAQRSKSRQEQFTRQLDERAKAYVGGELFVQLVELLGSTCGCEIDADDNHIINVHYPATFPDRYLRPELRLEIGPLASWVPHEERNISCYAAEVYPDLFQTRECSVRTIKAERTFWEKATILHQEFHRPEGNPQPVRYSRHYYDLARFAASPFKDTALPDLGLLESVVDFKQRFYPRGWARYDLAKPGTMCLVPTGHVLRAVEADYTAMAGMIFGNIPTMEHILGELEELEIEINSG